MDEALSRKDHLVKFQSSRWRELEREQILFLHLKGCLNFGDIFVGQLLNPIFSAPLLVF